MKSWNEQVGTIKNNGKNSVEEVREIRKKKAFESLKEVKKAWKEVKSGDFVRFKNKQDFFKELDKW
jgi:predicted nucleic acid-binding OB-fold protein